MSRLATLRASTAGGRSGRLATFGATRTFVVSAATTDSSVQVSRKRGWYGWSWKRDEVQADDVGELRELDHGVGLRGDGRDEDAELEVVAVVGHAAGRPARY